MKVRRVVTGHDARGKAVFVNDEQVDPISVALLAGVEFHRVWGGDAAATVGLASLVGLGASRLVRGAAAARRSLRP